jgi:hypothetical protein
MLPIIEKFIESLGTTDNEREIYNNFHEELNDFCNGHELDCDMVFDELEGTFILSEDSISYHFLGGEYHTASDSEESLIDVCGDRYYDSEENRDYYGIVFAEYEEEYTFESNCHYGWITNRLEGYFIYDNNDYVYHDGIYYRTENIANHRDVYHCSEHGWYYENCSECEDNNEEEENNLLFDYHSGHRSDLTDSKTVYKIGFEVEKEDKEMRNKETAFELFETTGWAKEHDGSLNGETGFELISPIFDLFSDKIVESFNKVTDYLDAKQSKSCGGHINYSIKGLQPQETFKTIEGYLPLLYSLYENRITNRYCLAKKSKELIFNTEDKYQSVAIKNNRIEFRIFSGVKSKKHLVWRLELIKIFALNPRKNPWEVLKDLCDKESHLHTHLLQVFSEKAIEKKIELFVKYTNEIEEICLNNILTSDFKYISGVKINLPNSTQAIEKGDFVTIDNDEFFEDFFGSSIEENYRNFENGHSGGGVIPYRNMVGFVHSIDNRQGITIIWANSIADDGWGINTTNRRETYNCFHGTYPTKFVTLVQKGEEVKIELEEVFS